MKLFKVARSKRQSINVHEPAVASADIELGAAAAAAAADGSGFESHGNTGFLTQSLQLSPMQRLLRDQPEEVFALPSGSFRPVNIGALEQMRILRTRVLELMRLRGMRSLLVTSAIEGEGKTLVATNLAFAISQVEAQQVLLVDGDLRKAGLASMLKVDVQRGLGSYLRNGCTLKNVCWRMSPSLGIVPTLPEGYDATELVNLARMKDFMREALNEYQLVVIDAPPILPIADTQVLASLVDGVLLVVGADHSPFELVREAAELVRPKIIGIVLNRAEKPSNRHYQYGYGSPAGERAWLKS